MQHPWWFPVRNLALHVLGNSMVLAIIALTFVFDSVLLEFAGRLIHSKFVFHVLVALGYAFLVGDTTFIGMVLIRNTVDSFKRGGQ